MMTSNILVKQLFDNILQMPYYKNYAAISGAVHNINTQENAIADIFTKYGLSEYYCENHSENHGKKYSKNHCEKYEKREKYKKRAIKQLIDEPSHPLGDSIPPMSFIFQPCGKNDSPDFLVKLHDGVILGIECKTTTKNVMKPMYNSGGIKQNYIYIFSNEGKDETTLYMGRDIITMKQQGLLDELIEKQKKLEREYNSRLREIDELNRGVSYYTRPMIEQSGDAEKTNYFTHSNRGQTEKNVYMYVVSLYNSIHMNKWGRWFPIRPLFPKKG